MGTQSEEAAKIRALAVELKRSEPRNVAETVLHQLMSDLESTAEMLDYVADRDERTFELHLRKAREGLALLRERPAGVIERAEMGAVNRLCVLSA